MSAKFDPFGARGSIKMNSGDSIAYYQLSAIADQIPAGLDHLPYTVKVLLENVLRNAGTEPFAENHVRELAGWRPGKRQVSEFPFLPARVLLQDLTGVPAVVDLSAMRSAMARLGGDPKKINPLVTADLVIDHSPLGAAGVRELQRRSAGNRHLPPGQPGIHLQGRATA
jgi:aconitate hydratase